MCTASSVEPLVTIRQASRESGISYATLRRLLKAGRLSYYTIAGLKRLKLSELRQAIEARGV